MRSGGDDLRHGERRQILRPVDDALDIGVDDDLALSDQQLMAGRKTERIAELCRERSDLVNATKLGADGVAGFHLLAWTDRGDWYHNVGSEEWVEPFLKTESRNPPAGCECQIDVECLPDPRAGSDG